MLLNYKNQSTLKQTDVMAKLVFKGYIDEVISGTSYYSDQSTAKVDCTGELLKEVQITNNTSKITKDIKEILAPLESGESRFVLIRVLLA